ncbi:MAG: glycosyl hydrolase, partial [Salinibacter sp.]
IGAASGGVWKTSDGGANWRPVFDQKRAQSIGALAVSRSAPNEVWAGTGEPYYIRLSTSHGNGIYKSPDGGETWKHMGLSRTGRIAAIEVHPRNPDVVYACAVGHGFSPQPERGVYRTRNGGESWERVLAVNDSTGCSDLALDPKDPSTLYAGMWQVDIDTWGLHSGGPHSGVYVTRDGGEHWTELAGGGLPAAKDSVGKISVAVAPSDPDRVYALLQRHDPTLYRSSDGGKHWRLMNRDHGMAERGPYYTRMRVSSDDKNVVYFASVNFRMTRDGGKTIVEGPGVPGGDFHDLWVDPTNADRVLFAHDGGATVTENGLESFDYVTLPIAQVYQVRVDDRVPYWVYTNRQDGPSYRGPSRSLEGGYALGLWHTVGGCESGMATPDTVSDRWVWSGCYDSGLQRYDLKTGHARDVRVWPEAGYGVPPRQKKYRWNWNFPIEISPHNHERVYVGSQHVHVTENGGQSWRELSPDLSRDIEAHQGDAGQLSTDNLNTFSASTLSSIQESSLEQGLIWAGTYDGLVWISRNGGEDWTNVTENIPDLPPGGRVSNIDPSRHDAGTAYVAVNRMESGDFAPYIYRTTDYGQSWTRIDGGIERSVFSPVHMVKEDPEQPGLLFAGTENGVWFSLDDGAHWQRLQRLGEPGTDGDLPAAPVYGLAVQTHADDLVVGTYGRGVWILDDMSPLRQLSAAQNADRPYLFEPGFAYRFRTQGSHAGTPSEIPAENPPYGISLDYWLPDSTEKPVTITVLSAEGDTVRTLSGSGTEGLNRTWWNLRHEPALEPTLRTPPPGRAWVPLGEDGTRPVDAWDLDLTREGPLAVPGPYTAVLEVGDTTTRRTLRVRKDPHTINPVAELRAQTEFALRIRNTISSVSRMINRLEWLKKDLSQLQTMLAAESGRTGPTVAALDSATTAELRAGAADLVDRAVAVEHQLFDVHLTGAREDAFRNPNKLYSRLSALLYEVSQASDDYPPTDQQREVFDVLRERLKKARADYRRLLEETVPAYRSRLRKADIPFSLSAGQAN